MRKALILPAALTLGLLAWSAPASADPGPRNPVANVDFTATGLCAFPVFYHVIKNNEVQTNRVFPNGSIVSKISGTLFSSVTNTNTGASMTLNISGPGTIVTNADGSASISLRGNSLFFFPAQAQTAFGLAPIFTTNGLVQYTTDAVGNVLTYDATGTSSDVCTALS